VSLAPADVASSSSVTSPRRVAGHDRRGVRHGLRVMRFHGVVFLFTPLCSISSVSQIFLKIWRADFLHFILISGAFPKRFSRAFLSAKGFYYGRHAALVLARWSAPASLGMPRVTGDFWVRGMWAFLAWPITTPFPSTRRVRCPPTPVPSQSTYYM
jgi:hypothetical protein